MYKNPIVPGDHPDPTILKDGQDYYMTFSSFTAYPGIIIWHSNDLVNWVPICTALTKYIGSVWALDLIKHNGRYYIYIPAVGETYSSIYVIHAEMICGPWSDPIDLHLQGCIDPGHAVGEDGCRYLFVNGIRRIALSDDGLSVVGQLAPAYQPWRYPDDWTVEMFAPEGPKLLRKDGYFYLISAVGGTAGPATSHMVIAARSKSIHGPWEDCPHNPIVRTKSENEPWWSRGHSSLVEGPKGDWWMVYHGYENGFRTLGRQTLLEPVVWADDGWFTAVGGDLSMPLESPAGTEQRNASVFSISDDFSQNKFGIIWSFFNPDPDEKNRVRYMNSSLFVSGKGATLANCSPMTMTASGKSYTAEVVFEPQAGSQGGISLFYNEKLFCGIGFSSTEMYTYNYGDEQVWMRTSMSVKRVAVRLINDKNVVTFYYSLDDGEWIKHSWQMEVSGFHHNVMGGFTSLKPALFSIGCGIVKFISFTYKNM